jgi:hypothetical protein
MDLLLKIPEMFVNYAFNYFIIASSFAELRRVALSSVV